MKETLSARRGDQPALHLKKRQFFRKLVRDRVGTDTGSVSSNMPRTRRPSVGCIITTYNSESTIQACLESVLSQTLPPDEIIVCDDASADGTIRLVTSVAAREDRIQIVCRGSNVGPSANRDLAIRALTTDMFTQVDGDDEFSPTKVEFEVKALRNFEEDVAYSDIELLTAKGAIIQDISGLDDREGIAALPAILSRSISVPRDMLMARSLYLRTGGYDYSVALYEDWLFKMQLCLTMKGRWRHAGGDVGTIYNRVQPGLSDRKPMEHAYWQLHGLARIADRAAIPNAHIKASAEMIFKPIRDDLKGMPGRFLEALADPDRVAHFRDVLSEFVAGNRRFGANEQELLEAIWQVLNQTLNDRSTPVSAIGELGRSQENPSEAFVGSIKLDWQGKWERSFALGLSLFDARLGLDRWPHVRFKFSATPQATVIEFHRVPNWPELFMDWPGSPKDEEENSILQLKDDVELERNVGFFRSARDRRLLQLIATTLPAAIRLALEQSKEFLPDGHAESCATKGGMMGSLLLKALQASEALAA